MSNNQAECYSFLKACQIAKEIGYKSIQIFGDSELLIKMLNSDDHFNNSTLNNILQRIRNTVNEFKNVVSFHVLQELNKSVDSLANKVCLLAQGNLSFNGEPSVYQFIP